MANFIYKVNKLDHLNSNDSKKALTQNFKVLGCCI